MNNRKILETLLGQLTSSADKKNVLEDIANQFVQQPSKETAGNLFDTICHLQDILSPVETLAYLGKKTPADRDSLYTWLDLDRDEDYAALLMSINKKGLPAQNILEHLEKESFSGRTILHRVNLDKFVDLLCHLRAQEINVNYFHYLLLKNDNDGKSVLIKITSLSPKTFLRLLNAGVIPPKAYKKLGGLFEPLIEYIDKLPEDEKKSANANLNGDKHPLHQFALAALTSQTEKAINEYRNGDSFYRNSNLRKHLEALRARNVPISIKSACLGVNVAGYTLADCNAHCGGYLDLLDSMIISPETALSVLNFLTQLTTTRVWNVIPTLYFPLLIKLGQHGISSTQLMIHMKSVQRYRLRNLSFSECEKIADFLDMMLSDMKNIDDVYKNIMQLDGIGDVGEMFAAKGNKILMERYLDILYKIADSSIDAANNIAKSISQIIEEFENATEHTINPTKIVRLLISLKKAGVASDILDKALTTRAKDDKTYKRLIENAKTDLQVLFQLLDNDALPTKAYTDLKSCKEALLEHIKSLPLPDRVFYLLKACTPGNPFYRLMSQQRGFTTPDPSHGTFGKIHDLLRDGIHDQHFIPAILLLRGNDLQKAPQWLQDKMVYLAKRTTSENKTSIVYDLLNYNLLPGSCYVELASDDIHRAALIDRIATATPENRLNLFVHSESIPNNAFKNFMHSHKELKATYHKYVKELLGDQRAVEADIKNQLAAEKVRRSKQAAAENAAREASAQKDRSKQSIPLNVKLPVTNLAMLSTQAIEERRAYAPYPGMYSLTFNELHPPRDTFPAEWQAAIATSAAQQAGMSPPQIETAAPAPIVAPPVARLTTAPSSVMFPSVPDNDNVTIDYLAALETLPSVPDNELVATPSGRPALAT